MSSPIADTLRYLFLIIGLIIGGIFVKSFFDDWKEKREIVTELQSVVTDSNLYRQFRKADADSTILKSLAMIHRADELGLPPSELFDRVFKRSSGDGFSSEPESTHDPIKEELARNALIGAFDAARRLEMFDEGSLEDLREGKMPPLPNGRPVILPLINPQLSTGLDRIIPNLEILPPERGRGTRRLNAVEKAAAQNLAKDLASAGIIETTVSKKIVEYYSTPAPKPKESSR